MFCINYSLLCEPIVYDTITERFEFVTKDSKTIVEGANVVVSDAVIIDGFTQQLVIRLSVVEHHPQMSLLNSSWKQLLRAGQDSGVNEAVRLSMAVIDLCVKTFKVTVKGEQPISTFNDTLIMSYARCGGHVKPFPCWYHELTDQEIEDMWYYWLIDHK